MKYALIGLLLSFSAFAQDMNFKEFMTLLDQHADSLSKVEVGMQMLNESYEIHNNECTLREKIISTIVDLKPEYALVLNERKQTDCEGKEVNTKFLSKDPLVIISALKTEMTKRLQGFSINRKNNIVTLVGNVGNGVHTYQYDLNSNLYVNWLHHHHAYPGIEDHNIKYGLKIRIVPMSEVEGLGFCERDSLTLDIQTCN
jgi:hypothetical protein